MFALQQGLLVWKIDIESEEGLILEANDEGVVDKESLEENPATEIDTIEEEIEEELKDNENKTEEDINHLAEGQKIIED